MKPRTIAHRSLPRTMPYPYLRIGNIIQNAMIEFIVKKMTTN